MSGRKRKVPPDLAGRDTLELLTAVATEALRLRSENKQLTIELSTARKRLAALERKAKPGKKSALPTAEEKPVEKKTPVRRQALGAGLARFLTPRRQS